MASSDELFDALNVDKMRFGREFFTPEPISMTGNYYPRYVRYIYGSLTKNIFSDFCPILKTKYIGLLILS